MNNPPVGTAATVYVTEPSGRDAKFTTSIQWSHWPLEAPLAAGAVVGTETVTDGAGQVVRRIPLVTLAPVPEGGLLTRLSDDVRLWFAH